jgi:hypothetical protein
MDESEPKRAPVKPEELQVTAEAALRTASRCIRIRQYDETVRLLELALGNVKRIQAIR